MLEKGGGKGGVLGGGYNTVNEGLDIKGASMVEGLTCLEEEVDRIISEIQGELEHRLGEDTLI